MRQIDGRDEQAVRSLISEFGPYGDVWVPNRQEIMEYAHRYRDFNRLHTDPEFARSQGYADVVAHGLLVLSMMTYLRPEPTFEFIGTSAERGVEPWAKVRKPIVAGDRVHGRGRISDVLYSKRRSLFFLTHAFEIRVESRDDELAVRGTYKVLYILNSD